MKARDEAPPRRGPKVSLLGRSKRGEGVVDRLLDCHDKIRRFTRLACTLATAEASPELIAGAARDCLAYFERGLPLHIEDEDRSLRPALERRGGPMPALAQMSEEHDRIDALLDSLLPLLGRIAGEPEARAELGPRLAQLGGRLEAEMEAHLTLEEQSIFPMVETLLDPAAQQAIVEQMRQRRA